MHDVVGEVVLARGDEDLGAADRVAAVFVRFGAGLQQAEVGTAMRFGQAHRAGPFARGDAFQEGFLLPVFAVHSQRLGGAVRQQRIGAPCKVGGIDHFLDGRPDGFRQPLPSGGFRGGQAGPAALDVLFVRALEALGRFHRAGFLVVAAAFLVAGLVERCEHLLRELGRLIQHRIDQFMGE